MLIEIRQDTPWSRALTAARMTVHKRSLGDKEPSDEWKRKILLARHSPIRLVEYSIKIMGIPYWVAMHLVRHHEGVQFFVATQRDDRVEHDRSRKDMPQGTLVDMLISANAEAIMNISAKRLCRLAAPETRKTWEAIIRELGHVDPILAEKCVPRCIVEGRCHELTPCDYCESVLAMVQKERYEKKE